MSAITIGVSDEDIAHGTRNSSCGCPIARAIYRAMGWLSFVQVGTLRVSLETAETEADIELPGEARRFITFFDSGLTPGPFSFELDVPDELLAVAP